MITLLFVHICKGECSVFFDVFNSLCAEKGISASRALLDLGMGKSSITRWKNGGEPSNSTKKKIADYFEVPVSKLMSGEEPEKEKTPTEKSEDVTFDDFTYAMYNESKELSEESKQKLLEMARFFKEYQDKEKG